METETQADWENRHQQLVTDPFDRYRGWCGTCLAVTESDDDAGGWCNDCGDRRN